MKSIRNLNQTSFFRANCLLALLAIAMPISRMQAQVFPNLGGQRAGISAMTFLKTDLSPRSLGMGGASVALQGDGYSMAINPAGAINQRHFNLAYSGRTIIPGVNQSFLGAIIPTKNRDAWMVSMNYLSSGDQKRRTEFQPFGDGSVYSSNAYKLGVGYSKALSQMFSFGVNVHYIREQLAQYYAQAAAVDMGFLYKTDWKDLSFAVGLQHFGVNSTISGSDLPVDFNRTGGVLKEGYGAPTMFSMGISMVPYKQDVNQILVSAQVNHPNDNSENLRIGVEYAYDSLLFIRAGYRLGVVGEHVSMGFGAMSRIGAIPFRVEFSALPTTYLGWQYMIGLSIGFQKTGQE